MESYSITCNLHDLPCMNNGRVPDKDAYYFNCPKGCEFIVSGPQLEQANKPIYFRDENEPI